MSSSDGIANMGTVRTPQPAAASSTTGAGAEHHVDLSAIFRAAFHRNMGTIFGRGGGSDGIDADADGDGMSALSNVLANQSTIDAAVTQRHALVDQRLASSVSRLVQIAGKLDAEYPLADMLASTSTGTWDPATFQPKNQNEAKAFAERMAVDMTEAAARLDIVKNQLDQAKLDVQSKPTSESRAKVQQLTTKFGQQMEYLAKLAGIVDQASGGSVRDIGSDAQAGTTERDPSTDVTTRELAHDMRSMGFDPSEIERMLGAGELSVGEQKHTGSDPRLQRITQQLAMSTLANFIAKLGDARRETWNTIAKNEQQAQQRLDDQAHWIAKKDSQRQSAIEARDAQQAALDEAAARTYAVERARTEQSRFG